MDLPTDRLMEILERVAASDDGIAVGTLLERLKQLDPALAEAMMRAFGNLSSQHGAQCYIAGLEDGAARERQKARPTMGLYRHQDTIH